MRLWFMKSYLEILAVVRQLLLFREKNYSSKKYQMLFLVAFQRAVNVVASTGWLFCKPGVKKEALNQRVSVVISANSQNSRPTQDQMWT